jgi:hypothetical protein
MIRSSAGEMTTFPTSASVERSETEVSPTMLDGMPPRIAPFLRARHSAPTFAPVLVCTYWAATAALTSSSGFEVSAPRAVPPLIPAHPTTPIPMHRLSLSSQTFPSNCSATMIGSRLTSMLSIPSVIRLLSACAILVALVFAGSTTCAAAPSESARQNPL